MIDFRLHDKKGQSEENNKTGVVGGGQIRRYHRSRIDHKSRREEDDVDLESIDGSSSDEHRRLDIPGNNTMDFIPRDAKRKERRQHVLNWN